MLVHSSSTCARSIGSFSSATLPARIFDRSSRSLTICSRICADERIVFVRCDCVADRVVRVSSSVMPTTPFIGVRSSWLMRSRKSLFARAASSSCRLLSTSSRVRSCTSASRRSRAATISRSLRRWSWTRRATKREQRERVQRVGPGRCPRCGVAMDRELERRLAPHRVGVRRAHLEHVIAWIEIRQRDAALRADVDPIVGEAGHAVGEPVVLGRREIEHAEVEGYDGAAIVELDAVAQPERRRARGPHAEHIHVRQRHARRLRILGQRRRIEDVEAAGSAEGHAPVAQPESRRRTRTPRPASRARDDRS